MKVTYSIVDRDETVLSSERLSFNKPHAFQSMKETFFPKEQYRLMLDLASSTIDVIS